MTDSFGRKITYLRLSVTDRCNYRCRYCMPEGGICKKSHSDILSIEEMTDACRAAVECGVRKIRLTGGEPLLRKGILDLCSGIRSLDGLEELAVTTNGSLLPEMAADLKEAGVDRLNISLDTLNADKFHYLTRCGSLADVQKGIVSAEKAGFTNTKINVVLIGTVNDDEISDFVRLTVSSPVTVRFIELMRIGECSNWDPKYFISADRVLEKEPSLQRIHTEGVAELYHLPGSAGSVGLIRPVSHQFCAQCNRIRITSDGNLKLCLHSDEEIPLRGLTHEEMIQKIRSAVAGKPEHHFLSGGNSSGSTRRMNEIGG